MVKEYGAVKPKKGNSRSNTIDNSQPFADSKKNAKKSRANSTLDHSDPKGGSQNMSINGYQQQPNHGHHQSHLIG
jgi:hypothetical protein